MKTNKDFSVYTITKLDEEQSKINYIHWSEGLSMIITKAGVTLELNAEEIEELVGTLPRTLGGTYG